MTMSPTETRACGLGWGMVGIGRLADLMIAPGINEIPGDRIAAACSRDLERARAFGARHRAGHVYDDYAAMLDDPGVDVVYVATPNALHVEHALAAIRAGKHVLVDKPMALTLDDGEAIVDAGRRAGVQVGVGFQLRHKPTNVEARRRILGGAIGRPSYFHMFVGAGRRLYPFDTWRADARLSGGGTLLNQGAHALDLVEFVSGSEIVEVTCLASPGPIEEVWTASCRLANGALATLSSNQVLDATPRTWLAVGDTAWLEGRGSLVAPPHDTLAWHHDGEESALATSTTNAYHCEVAAFSAAVTSGGGFCTDAAVGLRNIRLVDACYQSIREGRRVGIVDGPDRPTEVTAHG